MIDNTVMAEIPQEVTNESIRRFAFTAYRKTAVTNAVGPVTLSRDSTCQTKEGKYDLPAGWEGYFALDGDGDVYPVEKKVFESSYEVLKDE